MGHVRRCELGGCLNTHKGGTGRGGREWCHYMVLVSPVSLHGICCRRCHYHCIAPGVWQQCPCYCTLPWGVTQCHHGCTAPLVSHGAAVQPCGVAQLHCCSLECHMVSLSPRSAQGVTVTVGPPGATQCHCSSRGLSHRVIISPWCWGCHTMLCHCVAHRVSPTVTVTAGPQCITHCHRHCMAHGVSPTVTVTAQPGVPHTVTMRDPPQWHSLHPLVTAHPLRVTGREAPRHSTAGPSSPNRGYSHPTSPWGDTSPSPSPPPAVRPSPPSTHRWR